MEPPTVKHISETFIKPKLEDITEYSKQPYFLATWDLWLLSIHYNQKGLLFTKPQEHFSCDKLVESLKDSLALTLVHFYPLAGQLVTQIDEDQHKCVVFVDCDKGPGAQFLHATLNMTVSDILSPTHVPKVVHSLFEHNKGTIVNLDGQSRPLLSIQVTELVDGVFIGCSMNHAVVDGSSFWHFWKVWSEIHNAKTRPISISRTPQLIGKDSPLFFPYIGRPDEFVVRYEPTPDLVERMFHFSSESMKRLKARANNEINNKNVMISSFQALAAVIWRAYARANGQAPHEMSSCNLAINVRKRLEPPLPEEYFGNALGTITTTTTVAELLSQSLGWAASLLHKTIGNYDSEAAIDYVKRWAEAPSFVDPSKIEDLRSVKHGSSPRFDIYSNEFAALGRPVAVRSGFANKFIGKVNSYPGCEGGGSVDVEICLLPESMAALESDREFMDFVSLSTL